MWKMQVKNTTLSQSKHEHLMEEKGRWEMEPTWLWGGLAMLLQRGWEQGTGWTPPLCWWSIFWSFLMRGMLSCQSFSDESSIFLIYEITMLQGPWHMKWGMSWWGLMVFCCWMRPELAVSPTWDFVVIFGPPPSQLHQWVGVCLPLTSSSFNISIIL